LHFSGVLMGSKQFCDCVFQDFDGIIVFFICLGVVYGPCANRGV
jgi:hypothetical protein